MKAKGNWYSLAGWPMLLVWDWPQKLNHLARPLTLVSVLDTHNAVFTKVLGLMHRMTAKLHVVPQSIPQFCKPPSVPYAIRGRVEQELEVLHKSGDIKPVEFAEWAAPIVPIVTSDRLAWKLLLPKIQTNLTSVNAYPGYLHPAGNMTHCIHNIHHYYIFKSTWAWLQPFHL